MIVTELRNEKKSSQDISEEIYKDQQLRTLKNLGDLREAIEEAEDIDYPDRYDLIGVYKDTELDCHVTGVRSSILNKIKSRDYYLCTNDGTIDEDATELLQTKWFLDYLGIMLDSFLYGYSLIQVLEISDGNIQKIKSQPREYIVPEWECIKKDAFTSSLDNCIKFLEDSRYKNSMLWHNTGTLGLYANVSPHAISKKHLLAIALEKAELFGIPIRIGKTDINDPKLRNQMESMLENMGSSAWAVLDQKQTLELIDSKQGDVHRIFLEPMKMSNQEISKALAGSISIFDEKSFVGSSEAGERLFEAFVSQYMVSIGYEINNVLLPFMRMHGILKEGLSFKWQDVDNRDTTDKVDDIVKLAPYYEISPEFVEQYTGVEIEGVKLEPMQEAENMYNKLTNNNCGCNG